MSAADHELLELAARAAGVSPVLCYEAKRNCLRIGDRKSYSLWRPLTDDGDALRLAVKLEMTVFTSPTEAMAEVGRHVSETINAYDGSATRRCIVRAAAEIGKAMP